MNIYLLPIQTKRKEEKMGINTERVKCLHIPELINSETVVLAWEALTGAVGYEIEACFDKTFGGTGSKGIRWTKIDYESGTWLQNDTPGMTWQNMGNLDESHTIYRGTGAPIVNSAMDLNWLYWKTLNRTWAEHKAKGYTWASAVYELSHGLTFDSGDSMWLSFDEREAEDLSWQDIEEYAPHTGTHLSCSIQIPQYTKWAIFRIRAYDVNGDLSTTLTSAPIAVKYKSEMEIPVTTAKEKVQVNGEYADREEITKYTTRHMQFYNDNLINVLESRKRLPVDTVLTNKLWSGKTMMQPPKDNTNPNKVILQLEWQKAG